MGKKSSGNRLSSLGGLKIAGRLSWTIGLEKESAGGCGGV